MTCPPIISWMRDSPGDKWNEVLHNFLQIPLGNRNTPFFCIQRRSYNDRQQEIALRKIAVLWSSDPENEKGFFMESEDCKGFDPNYIPEPDAVASPELQHAWQFLEERYKIGDILTTKVVDFHNAGLIVEVNGMRGTILLTHIRSLERDLNQEERRRNIASEETKMKLQAMKDKELSVKIIELSAKRHQFILSECF